MSQTRAFALLLALAIAGMLLFQSGKSPSDRLAVAIPSGRLTHFRLDFSGYVELWNGFAVARDPAAIVVLSPRTGKVLRRFPLARQ